MRFGRKLLYLACTTLLASCGGGDSGDTGGGSVAVQQYPAGVWSGTAGPLGGTQQTFVGVIDGGSAGKGGVYYFAKDSGGIGYDGLYGTLAVNLATLRATGSTYFSTADAKFSAAPITVTGTVTGAASADSKLGATISGNYSNPAGTIAATGSIVPFSLTYNADLTERPSSLALIKGTYRTGGFFGSGALLTIDGDGKIVGSNVGCTLAGQIALPDITKGIYRITLGLGGDTTTCPQTGTTQSGFAVLQYDTAGVKSGIWIFTVNGSGTKNTFVLNATADAEVPTIPPATSTQSAEGLFTGSVTTVGGTAQESNMVVLPNNQFLLYRSVGAGYDVFYGALNVTPNSSIFKSSVGIYFAAQNAVGNQYFSPVALTGDVRTRSTLTGTFSDPSKASAAATIAMNYNSLYTAQAAALTTLAGKTYRMSGDFLGNTTVLTIDATGGITGTSTNNCSITGTITPYSSVGQRNLYATSLTYAGTACPLLGTPSQTGIGIVDRTTVFGDGLRIVTTAQQGTDRYNTVFLGGLVTTP